MADPKELDKLLRKADRWDSAAWASSAMIHELAAALKSLRDELREAESEARFLSSDLARSEATLRRVRALRKDDDGALQEVAEERDEALVALRERDERIAAVLALTINAEAVGVTPLRAALTVPAPPNESFAERMARQSVEVHQAGLAPISPTKESIPDQYPYTMQLLERTREYPTAAGVTGFSYSSRELTGLLDEMSKGVAVSVQNISHHDGGDTTSVQISIYVTFSRSDYDDTAPTVLPTEKGNQNA